MPAVPIPIFSKPGIQRDGTVLDCEYHVDGLWNRWDRGRARKIFGFRQMTTGIDDIARGMDGHPSDNELYVHIGSRDALQRMTIGINNLTPSGLVDRTPSGFVGDVNNMWQFAQMVDAVGGTDNQIIAHAAPNAGDISSDTATDVYLGNSLGTAALTAISSSAVSGGVCCLWPYLVVFGTGGYWNSSVANDPSDLTGSGSLIANITSKKIVRGLPVRAGAGNAPAGLFWSLDSLVRAAFVGGSELFSFDSISNASGILAAMSVIEHDGIYYWIGLDRFMVFNGVIQELPNTLSQNFFFDNVNWANRNKTFAFKVPRFGEIWWCFPFGADATEPNWALIYNTKERTWYDTPLPADGRSSALSPEIFRYPLVSSATATDNLSRLWMHEIGVDEVSGSPLVSKAIPAYFETGPLALPTGSLGQPLNRSLRVSVVEPDFIQSGDMTCHVIGRSVAKAEDVTSVVRTFPATPTRSYQQTVKFQGDGMRRELRFRFGSNTAGGNYYQGKCLAHVEPGDGTVLGATR